MIGAALLKNKLQAAMSRSSSCSASGERIASFSTGAGGPFHESCSTTSTEVMNSSSFSRSRKFKGRFSWSQGGGVRCRSSTSHSRSLLYDQGRWTFVHEITERR